MGLVCSEYNTALQIEIQKSLEIVIYLRINGCTVSRERMLIDAFQNTIGRPAAALTAVQVGNTE